MGWRPLEDCFLPEPTRKAPEEQRGRAPGGAPGRSRNIEAYLQQSGESGGEQRGEDGLVLPLEGPPGHPRVPLGY